MEQVLVVPCPGCGAAAESFADPDRDRWRCQRCRHAYYLRRCSACGHVSHVSVLTGWHQPWECVRCGEINTGFSQYRDPAAATVAELAADFLAVTPVPAPPRPTPMVPAPAPPDSDRMPHGNRLSHADRPLDSNRLPRADRPLDSNRLPRADRPLDSDRPPGDRRGPAAAPSAWPERAHRTRRRIAAAAVTTVAAVLVVVAVSLGAAGGTPAGQTGETPPGATRTVMVTAASVRTVDFAGVPGELTIAGISSGQVTLTGQLQWTGHAPVVVTRLNNGVLSLSYQCAADSPCTENYRLTVLGHTTTVVRQPAGRVVISGVVGPLSITAANVNVTASGLRSPSLAAMITSGQLSASFDAPPLRVAVTLLSAQAVLRLPDDVVYRVVSQVTSGYVDAAIPQATGAARVVRVRIDSGALKLLPS